MPTHHMCFGFSIFLPHKTFSSCGHGPQLAATLHSQLTIAVGLCFYIVLNALSPIQNPSGPAQERDLNPTLQLLAARDFVNLYKLTHYSIYL